MKYFDFLFDLYGTLADIHTDESKKELWQLLAVWYQSHGAAYTPYKLQKEYERLVQEELQQSALRHPDYLKTDIRLEIVFEQLYHQQNIAASAELTAETALFFRTISRDYIRLYPSVRTLLHKLRTNGRRCFLLTNAQKVFTMPELKLLGVTDLFDGIVISSQEECAKPDPYFFHIACQRYQIKKSSALMIGNDPYTDIAGANAYGIDSVYIHTNLSPKWTKTPDSTYLIEDGDVQKLEKLVTVQIVHGTDTYPAI